MARPVKKGLDYFPFDTHFFNDYKIMDLMSVYGTGTLIYIYALSCIYNEGYYLAIPLDKLTVQTVHTIGAKWVKKSFVSQVIYYCAEIGLFDNDLLLRNIITSAGIQRRYAKVTVRNKVDRSKFWLLGNEVLESVSSNGVSATENDISVTETPVNATKKPIKKSKENKSKEKNIKESPDKIAYADFVTMTEEEYRRLVDKHGEEKTARMIEVLDNYKGSIGRKYKSDYHAILNWVVKRVDDEFAAKEKNSSKPVSFDVESAERDARSKPLDFGNMKNKRRRYSADRK